MQQVPGQPQQQQQQPQMIPQQGAGPMQMGQPVGVGGQMGGNMMQGMVPQQQQQQQQPGQMMMQQQSTFSKRLFSIIFRVLE